MIQISKTAEAIAKSVMAAEEKAHARGVQVGLTEAARDYGSAADRVLEPLKEPLEAVKATRRTTDMVAQMQAMQDLIDAVDTALRKTGRAVSSSTGATRPRATAAEVEARREQIVETLKAMDEDGAGVSRDALYKTLVTKGWSDDRPSKQTLTNSLKYLQANKLVSEDAQGYWRAV